MAQSVVELFNLALSAIGTRRIVSSAAEHSREAEICNLWYPVVRDVVLSAAPWDSARKTARLALLAERDFDLDWANGDPEPGWAFAYGQPSDMLHPLWLDGFYQFRLGLRHVTVGNTTQTAKAVFTNYEDPVLTYIFRQEQLGHMAPDLYQAIALALGGAIARPLNGKAKMADLALGEANKAILEARVRSANENNIRFDHVPDWLSARGVVQNGAVSGYVYPSGPLLSAAVFATPASQA